MILIINKKLKEKNKRTQIWYDPFFKETVTLECDGYTIKTKYLPYCILNDSPVKINKAIKLYKEHNNIKYEDDYVLMMMKSNGLVYYGYIQEPEVHNNKTNNEISAQDSKRIIILLEDYDLKYSILNHKSKGFTIEIDENEEASDRLEEFLLQISRDYEYKET